MKLKLVVASMSVLGLVSCPLFAATTASTSTTSTTTSTTKHHHHRHHHKVMRHHVRHEVAVVNQEPTQPMEAGAPGVPANYAANYKGEVAPEVCTINQSTLILDETTQSIGRAMPNACNPGWYNRIQVSGGANFDLLKFGNRNLDYQGENYNRFSLNDLYLNVAANVSDWTKAFASLSYSDTTSTGSNYAYYGYSYGTYDSHGYSSVYSDYRLNLEQAYATVSNFDVSPFYLQFGKQFSDFSRYEIHPITRSMTQVLSEALRTSVKVGFILPMGLNGDVYAYDDPVDKVGQTKTTTNYGASLGYEQPSDQLGWDVGVGWVYNMVGAGDVAHAVSNFTGGGYNRRADAVAVYGDVNSGPFALGVRWTGAVSRFNALDLPEHGFADVTSSGTVVDGARGAQPWAVGVDGGYSFEAFGCRNNNIYVGYQHSHESSGLGLPESRWLAGYDVDVFKNTNFGVEWDHDNAYSRARGGNSSNTNLWTVRGAVKFG